MKRRILIGSTILIQLVFISCSKDYDIFEPDPNTNDTVWINSATPNEKLVNLFKELAVKPVAETIADISKGDTLHFNDGISLWLPEKICSGTGGSTASGSVKLELTFLNSRGQFIRNVVPTSANDNPVETSAELMVNITQDGQHLGLADGKYLIVSYKENAPRGNESTRYGQVADSYLDWVLTQDGSYVQPFSRADPMYPTQTITGYDVKLRQLRWVNCGVVTDTTNRSKVTATLPDIFTNANTLVFVVFKDFKSVVQMKDDADYRIFFSNHIPVGESVSVVSISAIDAEYYLGISEANTAANLNVPIKPQKKTYSEILDFLEKL